jgi:hypothetical protein
MGLAVAAMIAEFNRGNNADAAGFKSTPEGIKPAGGALPRSAIERAKTARSAGQ